MEERKKAVPRVMPSVRISTGVTGLDEVLGGGLLAGRTYLVRGGPGSGKTILGLHFLTAGAAAGETTLFITLEEGEDQIRRNAESLGFDLNGVQFLDLSPTSDFFVEAQAYDIFSPAEVERQPTTQKIVERVEALQPQRVFFEAMTQFRYLSPDSFHFHKQVLSFLRFLVRRGATVLFSSEGSTTAPDDDLQFVADGVIQLEMTETGRYLAVTKFRGSDFRGGRHSMRLTDHGMAVFPRLVPEEHGRQFVAEPISSGVPELDEMLEGGLERGTVTVITGPTGAGKTTLGLYFVKEAAGRGEHSVIYSFEEYPEALVSRAEAVNIPIRAMLERGVLSLVKIEPLRYSPDELVLMVREEVERHNAHIVMLDSVSGYKLCLRVDDIVGRLHTLCSYLRNMGVTTLLINEVEAVTGNFHATEYMADNIVFLRYLEMNGDLHKAIGVLKKRLSSFEKSLREIEITRFGIKVGQPLTNLRGILTGTPELLRPDAHGREQ
jgi:circadian clock protein KaiC